MSSEIARTCESQDGVCVTPRTADDNHRRVGMYPDPYARDAWNRTFHPLLPILAEEISRHGWDVAPVTVETLAQPARLNDLGLQVLHVHWPEDILINLHNKVYDQTVNQRNGWKRLPSRIAEGCMRRAYGFALHGPGKQGSTRDVHGTPDILQYRLAKEVRRYCRKLKAVGIPLVLQVHDIRCHGWARDSALGYGDPRLRKALVQIAAAVITQEECSWPIIFSQYPIPKHRVVAPLGDYATIHGPPIEKQVARRKLGVSASGRVFSYLGTARPNRNPRRTIQAFCKVAGEDDALVVGGNGMSGYIPECGQTACRVQVFDGLLSNEQMRDLFCASDFVVNDAREYLTSAVIRAAMSYLVPVICFPYGAAVDMAQDAAVFIGGGESALEQALRRAITMTATQYDALRDAACERNKGRTWEIAGERCATLYDRLVAEDVSLTTR